MADILISLIIPAFNVEDYIEKCLNSIKLQSYTNFEAIIIDDGSSDNTGKICDLICKVDNRFRIIHQINRGVSVARNVALHEAKGNIIGFVDADDYLKKNTLEIVAQKFSTNNIDVLLFGHIRVDENDNEIETRKGFIPLENDNNAFLKYTLITGKNSYLGVLWNKYFKKECLVKGNDFIQFSPKYKIGEDQVWLIKVALNINKISFVADSLYYYRIRNNSAVHMRSFSESKKTEIAARIEMVRLVNKYFPDLAIYSKIKYRHCISKIVFCAIKENDKETLKYVIPYAKRYFKQIMLANIGITQKVKEFLLQLIYCLYM